MGSSKRRSTEDLTHRIDALVELSRCAREDDVSEVLQAVGQAVHSATGFGNVVLNMYRPHWDDYEVVLVVGSPQAQAALLGTRMSRHMWETRLLAPRYEVRPGVYFIPGDEDVWEGMEDVFVPAQPNDQARRATNAWDPEDALMVRLSDSRGHALGVLSVDEPANGLMPAPEDLGLLRAICAHAEQALENAQRSQRALRHSQRLGRLLDAAAALPTCGSSGEVLEVACSILVPDLGFERVAAYRRDDAGDLALVTARNLPDTLPVAQQVAGERAADLLGPSGEIGGCWLHPAAAWHGPGAAQAPRSETNGAGPRAWHDHVLLVPALDPAGSPRALFAIEDPSDRLVPSEDDCRPIRLLIDQASAALDLVSYRNRLQYLANHDVLTGIFNRRALANWEDQSALATVALLCDIDNFKSVNDTYGHETGDAVLARFGELLRSLARDNDMAVRLGGEEFLLLLRGADLAGAGVVAQRILAATPRAMAVIVAEPVTVSIGLAPLEHGTTMWDAVRNADAALYRAKRAGRNRLVRWDEAC